MKSRSGDLGARWVSGQSGGPSGWRRGGKPVWNRHRGWVGVGLLCWLWVTGMLASAAWAQRVESDFEVRFLQGGTLVQVQLAAVSGGSAASTRGFSGGVVRDGVRVAFPSGAVLTRAVGQSQLWEYETAGLNGLPVLRIQYDALGSGSLRAALGASGEWVAASNAYQWPVGSPMPGSHVFAYRLNEADPAVNSGTLDALISGLVAGSGSLVEGVSRATAALQIHSNFQRDIEALDTARLKAAGNLRDLFGAEKFLGVGTPALLTLATNLVEKIVDEFRNPFELDGDAWVKQILLPIKNGATADAVSSAYSNAALDDIELSYPANYSSTAKVNLAKKVYAELEAVRVALVTYRTKARAYRAALVSAATTRETERSNQRRLLAGSIRLAPQAYSTGVSDGLAEDLLTSVEDHLNEVAAQAAQSSGVLWAGNFESAIAGGTNQLRTVLANLASPSTESLSDAVWQEQEQPQLEGMPSRVWANISDRLPENYSIASVRALLKLVIPHLLSALETNRKAVVAELGIPKGSVDLAEMDEFSWAMNGTGGLEAFSRFKGLVDIRSAERAAGERALAQARFNRDTLRAFQGYGWGVIRFRSWSNTDRRLVADYSGVSPAGVSWQGTSLVRVDSTGQSGFVAVNLVSGTSTGVAYGGTVGLAGVFPVSLTSGGSGVVGTLSSSGAAVSWNRLPCVVEGPVAALASSGSFNVLGQQTAAPAWVLVGLEDPVQKTALTAFGARVEAGTAAGSSPGVTLKIAPAGSEFQVVTGSLVSTGTAGVAARFSGKVPYPVGGVSSTFSGVWMPVGGAKTVGYGFLQSGQTGSVGSVVVKLTEGSTGPSEDENAPVAQLISGTEVVTGGVTVVAWKGVNASVLKVNVGVALAANRTTVQLLRGGSLVEGGAVLANSQGEAFIPMAKLEGGSNYQLRVLREFLTKDSPLVESGSFTIKQRSVAGTFQALLGYGTLTGGNGSPHGNPYRARLTISPNDLGSLSGNLELVDLRPVLDEAQAPAPAWVADPDFYPITDPLVAPSGILGGGSGGLSGGSVSGGSVSFQTRMPAVLKYSLTSRLAEWRVQMDSPVTGVVYSEPGLAATLPVISGGKSTGHELRLYVRGDILATPVELNRAAGVELPRMEMALVLAGSATVGGGSVVTGSCLPAAVATGLSRALGSYPTAGSGWSRLRLRDTYTWFLSGNRATCAWRRGASSKTSTTVGTTLIGADGSIPCMLQLDRIETPILRTGTGEATVSSSLTTTAVGMLRARLTLRTPVNLAAPVYELGADSLTYVTGATVEGSGRYKNGWFPLPSGYLGLTPGGFGWAERMLTRTLSKVQTVSERLELGQEYELRIENTRTGQSTSHIVKAGGSASSTTLSPVLPVSPVVVSRLSVTASTGVFSGSLRPEWATAAGTVSGTYVRDDSGLEPNLLARGISADVSAVWSLYRK
jgi:hypothetical protein